jgi:hypothetical protein
VITNYNYSTDGGATFTPFSPAQTSSPVTITGLTNGTPYTIALEAVNSIGNSVSSATVNVTPAAGVPPNAPTLIYTLAGDTSAYIYFTAGAAVSSPITNYEYTTDNEATWTAFSPLITTTPVMISGLTNAVSYNVKLRSVNINGESVASNSITVVPEAASTANPPLYYDPNNGSYSGSGSTVANLGSYGTFNGTKQPDVTYVVGTVISRYVFDFNGSTYINFGNYNFGLSFTVSAWLYPRNKNSINGILANTTANQAPLGFKFGWNTWTQNNKTMYYEGGNGSQGNSQATINDAIVYNTWQYVTYILDTVNNVTVFLRNGTPVTTASYSNNITVENVGTSVTPFYIGAFVGNSYQMNAQLGYIKIYNDVLSVGQIQEDYNSSKASFGL